MQDITKKANAAIGPLYPIAAFIPRHILKQIYVTYVRPIFDYSDVVYHGHLTVTDSLSLERIQNRAARLITGTFRRTSSSALLKELGLTTLHSRRQINSLNILFKTKQNAPRYLQEIIPTTRLEITARKLRSSSNLTLPPNRVTSYKNSFISSTIRLWNKLPENIRMMTCSRSFKKAITKRLALKKPPTYYVLGNKEDNILHTRLRLGMSSLNAHLFKINSTHVDSPNCNCAPVPETSRHYFFLCSNNISLREELDSTLQSLIANYRRLSMTDKLAIILHGRTLDDATGLAVAASVQRFIRKTKRFEN